MFKFVSKTSNVRRLYIIFKVSCIYGYENVVKLLLKDVRIDASADRNYLIVLAVENNNINIVKLLMRDQRVYPLAHIGDAFYAAIYHGYNDIFHLLLNDYRYDNYDGYQALVVASNRA